MSDLRGVGPLSRVRERVRVRVRVFGQQPVVDDAQHGSRLDKNLPIVEAQHMKAIGGEYLCTSSVRSSGVGLEVLSAVEFDHQPRFDACEIGEVRANRVLASELVAVEPVISQVSPQQSLCVG